MNENNESETKFEDESKFNELREPTSKFVKIRCPKCKNEQFTFGKASINVKCLVCGKSLAEVTGGKTKIKARILEVLE